MRLPEALASLFIAVWHTMFAENIYIVHTFLNWIKPGVNKLIKPKSMSKEKMTKNSWTYKGEISTLRQRWNHNS